MIQDIKNDIINNYINWLKDNMSSTIIGDYLEIDTPFLDRFNDHIQFYIKKDGDKYLLTDDGHIINDLLISGVDLTSEKRKNLLGMFLSSLGMKTNQYNEIYTDATIHNLPQKKHMMIQAMMKISDMFLVSHSHVKSIFFEDIKEFFEDNEIRSISGFTYTGRSGFTNQIDFVIPASKKVPLRMIKALNNPTNANTKTGLFMLDDIRDIMKEESRAYLFLNDTDKIIKPDILTAISQYNVKPIKWSDRQNYIEELAA